MGIVQTTVWHKLQEFDLGRGVRFRNWVLRFIEFAAKEWKAEKSKAIVGTDGDIAEFLPDQLDGKELNSTDTTQAEFIRVSGKTIMVTEAMSPV